MVIVETYDGEDWAATAPCRGCRRPRSRPTLGAGVPADVLLRAPRSLQTAEAVQTQLRRHPHRAAARRLPGVQGVRYRGRRAAGGGRDAGVRALPDVAGLTSAGSRHRPASGRWWGSRSSPRTPTRSTTASYGRCRRATTACRWRRGAGAAGRPRARRSLRGRRRRPPDDDGRDDLTRCSSASTPTCRRPTRCSAAGTTSPPSASTSRAAAAATEPRTMLDADATPRRRRGRVPRPPRAGGSRRRRAVRLRRSRQRGAGTGGAGRPRAVWADPDPRALRLRPPDRWHAAACARRQGAEPCWIAEVAAGGSHVATDARLLPLRAAARGIPSPGRAGGSPAPTTRRRGSGTSRRRSPPSAPPPSPLPARSTWLRRGRRTWRLPLPVRRDGQGAPRRRRDRGAFSVAPRRPLDTLGSRTTYRSLLTTVRARVDRTADAQRPGAVPPGGRRRRPTPCSSTAPCAPVALVLHRRPRARSAGRSTPGIVHGLRDPVGDEAFVLACSRRRRHRRRAWCASPTSTSGGRPVEPVGWAPADRAYRRRRRRSCRCRRPRCSSTRP